MALWNKVKTELDRAGRVAQGAIDEGKLRLEAMRARQLADRAAQALGYAIYRARKAGGDMEADAYTRLSNALAEHEAEAEKLEAESQEIAAKRKSGREKPNEPPSASDDPSDQPPA
jgi:hypothetical protein